MPAIDDMSPIHLSDTFGLKIVPNLPITSFEKLHCDKGKTVESR